MNALVPVVLVFGSVQPADPPPKAPTAAEELQRFQGTWRVESWEEGGKALAGADLKARGVFFGGNVFVLRKGGDVLRAGVVQLDPGKSPRTANLSVKEGEGKDGVMLGIYELDGETLRLGFDPDGQARPAGFKPDAAAGFTVITLKKPKPVLEEAVDIVGRYRSELTEATGKSVVTDARIERRGDGYLVTYTQGEKVLFVGTALRRGDQLSMGWVSAGRVGVSVYKIEPGPKLTGEYTILGGIGLTGTEVLTPWRKVD